MTTTKKTQCERVLSYMRCWGSINQLQALADLGIMRLASRISDLKKDGHVIDKQMREGRNRFGEKIHYAIYTLVEDIAHD